MKTANPRPKTHARAEERVAAMLRDAVEAAKEDLLAEPLVRLLASGAQEEGLGGDRRTTNAREGLWDLAAPYLDVWTGRKAREICQKLGDSLTELDGVLNVPEELLTTAVEKLGAAVRQILLAIAVVEDGNRTAAEWLLQELLPRLEYLASRFEDRGRHRGLTHDDLLNEVCLKYHRSIGRFNPYHTSCPMVGTFVVNIVLNHLRDVTSQRQADRYLRGRGRVDESEDELRRAHRERAWEQHRSDCRRRNDQETRDAVSTICTQLVHEEASNPQKVMAFRLWFFRSLGYAEIGQYMRQTTGTGSTGWAHGAVREVARLVLERLDPERLPSLEPPAARARVCA